MSVRGLAEPAKPLLLLLHEAGKCNPVAFALLLFLLVLRVDVLSLRDPVQITFQIFLQLLFLSKLLEISTSLRLLSLFRELSNKARPSSPPW